MSLRCPLSKEGSNAVYAANVEMLPTAVRRNLCISVGTKVTLRNDQLLANYTALSREDHLDYVYHELCDFTHAWLIILEIVQRPLFGGLEDDLRSVAHGL